MYLNNAQFVLGDAFDYAVNVCDIPGKDFVILFLVSSISKRMEKGEPAILAGKSGIEIVHEIVLETKGEKLQPTPHERFHRTKEYWIGWATAYYQWYSDMRYRDIFKMASYEDLEKMYHTLHETDISKFADIMNPKVRETFPDTNLKRIRLL